MLHLSLTPKLIALALVAAVLVGCSAGVGQPSARPSLGASPTPAQAALPSATPEPAATAVPTPSPPPAAGPTPSPLPRPSPSATPEPEPEPFGMNLYREGAFVSEYTPYYCLPAAMQVMINIMGDDRMDTSRETQERLYELAGELDGVDLPRRVHDVEPEGWSRGLESEGYGRWEVRAEPTRRDAIRLAARQIRLTGKPVGLLTWRGAHSWVMSGFEATADPLQHDDFEVTGAWIQDVWWPRVSTIWGESDPPNTLVPFERLDQDYLKYRRPYGKFPDKDGQFVLVIPLEDDVGG